MQKVSSAFKKPKEDSTPEENGAQANGKVNGAANGKRHSKASSYVGPEENHSAKRNEVVATFEKYAQLIHASRRPLPTQTGDGTYLKHEASSSLFQGLKALGFKNYATLMEVMKVRASGQLVDDKTMLMERIIQVPIFLRQVAAIYGLRC